MIGLGRPLCVDTDAPARLLEGAAELARYEDRLDLLPDWLGFLKRFQTIKAINGFAGIYWFYQQIWLLGHEGRTDPGFAVFKAFRLVDARGKRIMKQRRALL